jgi:hypothetical protein
VRSLSASVPRGTIRVTHAPTLTTQPIRRVGSGLAYQSVARTACSQGSHPEGRPLARPAVGSRARRRRAPSHPGPVVSSTMLLWASNL